MVCLSGSSFEGILTLRCAMRQTLNYYTYNPYGVAETHPVDYALPSCVTGLAFSIKGEQSFGHPTQQPGQSNGRPLVSECVMCAPVQLKHSKKLTAHVCLMFGHPRFLRATL